jgi:hypothetical protein
MPRPAVAVLLALSACPVADPAAVARPATVSIQEGPGGARLVVDGVRVGSTEEEARLALGSPGAPPRRLRAGPPGARVRAAFTVRAGRVASLALDLDGPPWVLMKVWVALAGSARAAGETCGPDGCRDRERPSGGAHVLVERRSSWPVRLAALDPGAPAAESAPAVASAR